MLTPWDMSHILVDDGELALSARSPGTFARVYREHIEHVWRALVHLGVRSTDVEDVAHDVFLTVRRRLDSFEGRSALRTWIYGICIRTASDYRSRAFRRRELLQDEVPELGIEPAQLEQAQARQLAGELARLLEVLRDEQRVVFVLYEIEELSMKEVAQILGCPLQTAHWRLHAARATLRALLTEKGMQP